MTCAHRILPRISKNLSFARQPLRASSSSSSSSPLAWKFEFAYTNRRPHSFSQFHETSAAHLHAEPNCQSMTICISRRNCPNQFPREKKRRPNLLIERRSISKNSTPHHIPIQTQKLKHRNAKRKFKRNETIPKEQEEMVSYLNRLHLPRTKKRPKEKRCL